MILPANLVHLPIAISSAIWFRLHVPGRNIQSISNTALDAAEAPRFYGEQQQNVRGVRTGNVRESSEEG